MTFSVGVLAFGLESSSLLSGPMVASSSGEVRDEERLRKLTAQSCCAAAGLRGVAFRRSERSTGEVKF